MLVTRYRERGVGVTSLGADHAPPVVHRPSAGDRLSRVSVDASDIEHLVGQGDHELDEIGGAATGQHLQRLGDFDGVTDGQAQRNIHGGDQCPRAHARIVADLDHGAGELLCSREIGHECSVARLHVQDETVRALGNLLAHDARGDQRNRLDRSCDIAKRVQLLIGWCQSVAGCADHTTRGAHDIRHLLVGQQGTPPGDGFHLVQSAPEVAEATTTQLRNNRSARGDDGYQRKRDFVPYSPG